MAGSARSLANGIAGFFVSVLMLSPLLIGANRPQLWLFTSAWVFLGLALYFWAMARSRARPRFDFGEVRWAAYLYGLYIVVVAGIGLLGLAGGSRVDVLYGILRTLSYAGAFYLAAQAFVSEERAKSFVAYLRWVMAAFAAYGLVAARSGVPVFFEKAHDGFASAPFINRNNFATYMAIAAAIALAGALAKRVGRAASTQRRREANSIEQWLLSVMQFVLAGLFLVAALASGSRMGVFVTVLGAVTVLWLWTQRRVRDEKGWFWATLGFVVVLGGAATVVWFNGDTLLERLGTQGLSSDARWDLYRNVWQDMVAAHPWTGTGLDSFATAFRQVQDLSVTPDRRWLDAHNTYLELWAETGLFLGSLPPLTALLLCLSLWRRRSDATLWRAGIIDAALAASLIAAVHSMVDFSFEIPAITYTYVVLLAVALARDRSGADVTA